MHGDGQRGGGHGNLLSLLVREGHLRHPRGQAIRQALPVHEENAGPTWRPSVGARARGQAIGHIRPRGQAIRLRGQAIRQAIRHRQFVTFKQLVTFQYFLGSAKCAVATE